ncbi:MAG: carbohydrate ABC transporter permease [Spirochaetales bacterium]|nr:carbohydrate ABC transporter permease [Spirochaetales bacterium]
MNRKKTYRLTFIYLFLSLVAVIEISPLMATLLNSLRTNQAIKKSPVGFPDRLNIENYTNAWKIGEYSRAFLNSGKVSLTVSFLVLLCSIIAGYFLARISGKIQRFFLLYWGAALSIPVFSFMVPLYYAFANLNLVNTHSGLILIYTAVNLPFNILLARTFILGIPGTLDEAAIIDGCSTYQLIWKIIVPLAKPIITTIVLIVFVTTWNEFTLANTFLQKSVLKTASTRYVLFVGERGSDMSLVYTAGMITMLPIIGVFIFLQNFFISGMTAGSIKE